MKRFPFSPAASAMTHTAACHWRLSFDSLIFTLSITKTNPVQLQQWVWTDVHMQEKGCYCFLPGGTLLPAPKTPHVCQPFLLIAGQLFPTSLFMFQSSYSSIFCRTDLFNNEFKTFFFGGGVIFCDFSYYWSNFHFHWRFEGENPLWHFQGKHVHKHSHPGLGFTFKHLLDNLRLVLSAKMLGLNSHRHRIDDKTSKCLPGINANFVC